MSHRGTHEVWATTLDDALAQARAEIAAYVGDRRVEIETRSEPSDRLANGGFVGGWRVRIDWCVVDPVPPVPPNTGKTLGGRHQ